ncbi:MAG: peptidase S41, partial [Flavobacterium sp.]|nr:peptidase S41 [Flavobacterium sp.]
MFEKINILLQREHFRPKPINDSLSVYVFDTFMDDLDSNRNLFTQAEYKNLCQHRLKIDDYILTKNCRFMDDFVSVYTFALNRKKIVLEKLQRENLNYIANDSVRFSKDFFPFDMEEKNIEKIWNKRIRYDILEEIAKSGKNLDSLHLNFKSLEKTAKQTIFDNNLCKVNSILNSNKGL